MRIRLSSIIVDNQSKALAFYTETLGFKKKHDIPLTGEYRWITVTSPEGPDELELVLEPNANPAAKVYQSALFEQGVPLTALESADIDKEYEKLKGLGVVFNAEPKAMGPVKLTMFSDTCGNWIQLYQPMI